MIYLNIYSPQDNSRANPSVGVLQDRCHQLVVDAGLHSVVWGIIPLHTGGGQVLDIRYIRLARTIGVVLSGLNWLEDHKSAFKLPDDSYCPDYSEVATFCHWYLATALSNPESYVVVFHV